MDIRQLLIDQAQKQGQKPALVFENQTITFAQMRDLSFRAADHLISCGVKAPEKVAVFMPNTPEAAYAFFGIFALNLNP